MVRSRVWKSGVLKPHLKTKSTEDLVAELTTLQIRRHKAKRRHLLLLKLATGLTALDFHRMQEEVTAEVAQISVAITDLKLEIKRRGEL